MGGGEWWAGDIREDTVGGLCRECVSGKEGEVEGK